MQLFQRHWLYQVLSSWLLQLMQSLLLSSTTVIAKFLCVQCLVFSVQSEIFFLCPYYIRSMCYILVYFQVRLKKLCWGKIFCWLLGPLYIFHVICIVYICICMTRVISDLICHMFLPFSGDWPSFAGCLYLVFHSLADTYKKFQACTTQQKVRRIVNCMFGISSDLICYMFLLLSKDSPSFAGCLYLVFPSLLTDI